MAREAGVTMTECRMLEEHGRRHFATRRFDRDRGGVKTHVHTLGAMAHVSYNEPGAYSYEQAFRLMCRLRVDAASVEQQFRRMVFNVIARNHDDHVKNISFLASASGDWSLSPAYDITWAYRPGNRWLAAHQMTINGKRDDITAADLHAVAEAAGIDRARVRAVFDQVTHAVGQWPQLAAETGVDRALAAMIARSHRLRLPGR
jgi:serine/threonine-protein kinase HipA